MNLLTRLPSAVAVLIYREPETPDLEIDADAWTHLTRQGQANARRAREWKRDGLPAWEQKRKEEAE